MADAVFQALAQSGVAVHLFSFEHSSASTTTPSR
jgi:hypothetical protein